MTFAVTELVPKAKQMTLQCRAKAAEATVCFSWMRRTRSTVRRWSPLWCGPGL